MRDVGCQLVDGFGEVDFACDDGVEPAFDDGPDTCAAGVSLVGWRRGRGLETLKYPGGFVDEDDAEAFGVVCFEAIDHELYGAVVLAFVKNAVGLGGGRTMFAIENPVMSNTIAYGESAAAACYICGYLPQYPPEVSGVASRSQ